MQEQTTPKQQQKTLILLLVQEESEKRPESNLDPLLKKIKLTLCIPKANISNDIWLMKYFDTHVTPLAKLFMMNLLNF